MTGDIVRRSVDAWMDESEEFEEEISDFRKGTLRRLAFIAACIAAAFIAAGIGMNIGDYRIDFFETYRVVWAHLTGNVYDETADWIMFQWRLPRICCDVLAGVGLAAAGAVMQSILRNPLADPYTTGISSGAAFGATVAMALGLSLTASGFAVVANAFFFALIPTAVILAVSKLRSASPATMIMTGIAIMYMFNATSTLIRLYADPDTQAAIFAWTVGTTDIREWSHVLMMTAFVIAGTFACQLMARRLNVIAAGDESARSIGVNAERLRVIALLVVSLLAAGIVSFTGLIGFVGLVCPHIARLIVGSDSRYLIPASAAFGALLLLAADIIGHVVVYGHSIQVGVITAFLGAPILLYLIIKQGKEVWRWNPSSKSKGCRAGTGDARTCSKA